MVFISNYIRRAVTSSTLSERTPDYTLPGEDFPQSSPQSSLKYTMNVVIKGFFGW